MVFYAQSTITVISGRKEEEEEENKKKKKKKKKKKMKKQKKTLFKESRGEGLEGRVAGLTPVLKESPFD